MPVTGAADKVRNASGGTFALVLLRNDAGDYELDMSGERDYAETMHALAQVQSRLIAELNGKVEELYIKAGKAAL